MYSILIRTVGEVAFHSRIKMTAGFACDVPTDQLGFPSIPMTELLADTPFPVPDVEVGFAHPVEYYGVIREASLLESRFPIDQEYIRSIYTAEHFDPQKDLYIRALKSGQTFLAPVWFRNEDKDAVARHAASIRHLGIQGEGITGEVECRLVPTDEEPGGRAPLNPNCTYTSLEAAVHLITPAVCALPYRDGAKTYPYLPGKTLRKALTKHIPDPEFLPILQRVSFSHAYIADETRRMLPVPLCMSLVKLDKDQLRYRLSPGKDPAKAEQTVSPGDAYTGDFQQHLMTYVKPEIERISSGSGEMYDALRAGQAFRFSVYGTDDEIRLLSEQISRNRHIKIGNLTAEGFGEARLEICGLREERIRTECPASCFDLVCLSDTMIRDVEGLPSCRAEDLLWEVERKLGVEDCLEIVGKYTEVYRDFDWHYEWKTEGPVVRCLKAGSVLRIRTKDGRPLDLFPILHGFIGENTRNGYGEIMVYPAGNVYYRAAKQLPVPLYLLKAPVSYSSVSHGAAMIQEALARKLQALVRRLGWNDRDEFLRGVAAEKLLPDELLVVMRDSYAPQLGMDTIRQWYMDGLEEGLQSAEEFENV